MKTLKYTLALFITILTFNSCQKEDHHQVSQNTDQVEAMSERSLESRNSSSCGYIASLQHCFPNIPIDPDPPVYYSMDVGYDDYDSDAVSGYTTGHAISISCSCLINKYRKALGYNSQLYQAIDQSIVQNSNSRCSRAADPRKVFDAILAHGSVSGNAGLRKQVYMAYIRLVLDLDGRAVSKLEKSYHLYGNGIIEQVYDVARCGQFVFCPGVSNQNDKVSTAVNYMMTGGSWTMNKFYSKMHDLGYVDVNSAISTFEQKYGLRLSNTERTKIINRVSDGCNVSKAVAEAYSRELHAGLKIKYSDYRQSNVNIDQFLRQHGAEKYMASAELYESYKQEVNESPNDPYKWQLMMEVFKAELGPLLLEFIPGVGDFIGAYNDFKQGNYFWGCVSIVTAVFPGKEVLKIINKADNIRDAWKKVSKLVRLWNKIFSTSGGQKVLNKMPQSWKNLPGSKLARKSEGLVWEMNQSSYHFRLMEKVPKSKIRNKQVPYSRFVKNIPQKGTSYMTVTGDWMVPTGNKKEFVHNGTIYTTSDSLFQELTHIPISDITDEMLNKFF